jgi:hypothetical protein
MAMLTVDQELKWNERLRRNQDAVEARDLGRNFDRALVRQRQSDEDRQASIIDVECVVCGAKMEALRRTKRTCSSRCRLKLSRAMRAVRALPEREQRKRDAEIRRRWRRVLAEEKNNEKSKPRQSRKEVVREIKHVLATR